MNKESVARKTENGGVTVDGKGIAVGGEYKTLLCASLFYFRIPRELWQKRIQSLKAAGYNCADVYFPWNYHERADGSWDFSGNRDAREFLRLLSDAGLYVVARPGPYICSEWDGGGLPARVCAAGYRARSADPAFLAEADAWYSRIVPIIADFQIGRGGTVILVQLDNELDFYDCPDPEKYIAALRGAARKYGIAAPLFACAGQGSAAGAGGLTDGVLPTYNFYPSIASKSFDGVCRAYNDALRARGLPLLVSETGREHSLLKRELAAGAKLLGAYNQVAGSNFGYTQSVNNWGTAAFPLAFVTTLYDFGSLIAGAGHYSPEIKEARLLARQLAAYGDALAAAEAAGEAADNNCAVRCGFETSESHNCLRLAGGGLLLCVPNTGGADGTADICAGGEAVRAFAGAARALLLPVDVPLGRYGIEGSIALSNAEVFSLSGKELVFYTDGEPDIRLTVNGRYARVAQRESEVGGVSVKCLTSDGAFALDCRQNGDVSAPRGIQTAPIARAAVGAFAPFAAPLPCPKGLTFSALGRSTGTVVYEAAAPMGRDIALYGAADVVSAYDGGRYIDTRVGTGGLLRYPASESGAYRFRVEKWGHSNFDDSRLPSLYIQSQKGAEGIYSVEKRAQPETWRFQQYGEWLPDRLRFAPDCLDARLNVNSWNSTRLPLIALYYTTVERGAGAEKFMLALEGGGAECAVYVNGILAGRPHPAARCFDLSAFVPEGGAADLQLLVRKANWAERTGEPCLYELKALRGVTCRAFAEEEISGIAPAGEQAVRRFPVEFAPGAELLMTIDLNGTPGACCCGVLRGTDYKATFVLGGRVIARMIAPNWKGVAQQGGSDTHFYIPGVWRADGKLRAYVEGVGDSPRIESFALEYRT